MWEMNASVRSKKVKLPKGKMKMNASQGRRRIVVGGSGRSGCSRAQKRKLAGAGGRACNIMKLTALCKDFKLAI
jgi:hypothetical protein